MPGPYHRCETCFASPCHYTTLPSQLGSLQHHRIQRQLPQPSARPYAARPTPRAVFDFIKKAGEEQKKALDAIRSNKGMEYVRDKVKRDIEQVSKFNDGLSKSRERLARDLTNIVTGGAIDKIDDVLEELEEVLLSSDLGVDTVERILDDLRTDATQNRVIVRDDIKQALKESLVRILDSQGGADVSLVNESVVSSENLTPSTPSPTIYFVIGANGMGKTTTIGKLATRLRRQNKSVLVAACDTFRAAAVEQLSEWVDRADAQLESGGGEHKAPSAILYAALRRAKEEAFDYVIVDTSGRLHTNSNLMGELQKMVGVIEKFRAEGPHETLLVVDASIGRNAVTQARTWQKEVGVSGLVVTKLDGTARAGFVVSCVDELKLPVKLVGVGEGIDDLRDFDSELFVDGLVG